jgi:hypothetical protein
MMLAVYALFATPDARARKVRFDPDRYGGLANLVESADWLRRYEMVRKPGSAFVVVTRDERELTGIAATAELFASLPIVFPFWPIVAIAARTRR